MCREYTRSKYIDIQSAAVVVQQQSQAVCCLQMQLVLFSFVLLQRHYTNVRQQRASIIRAVHKQFKKPYVCEQCREIVGTGSLRMPTAADSHDLVKENDIPRVQLQFMYHVHDTRYIK